MFILHVEDITKEFLCQIMRSMHLNRSIQVDIRIIEKYSVVLAFRSQKIQIKIFKLINTLCQKTLGKVSNKYEP